MVRTRTNEGWRITRVEVTTYDRRNRAVRNGHSRPTWDQVQAAILSLNAGRRSEMVIEAANGSLLVIGGGQGRFHVQLTYPRGSEPCNRLLTDPSRKNDTEELIVGGVTTPLPARLIVDQAKARSAVFDILTSGVPVSIGMET